MRPIEQIRRKAIIETHKLLLEALRHREQEIIRFIAILAPAIGGFIWLLTERKDPITFMIGTIGILFFLFLGSVYSLALGYNYRYLLLQIKKIEKFLEINDIILKGWSKEDVSQKYYLFKTIPWCTPPEIIKVFWCSFLLTNVGIIVVARYVSKNVKILTEFGLLFLVVGVFILPMYYGLKINRLIKSENTTSNFRNCSLLDKKPIHSLGASIGYNFIYSLVLAVAVFILYLCKILNKTSFVNFFKKSILPEFFFVELIVLSLFLWLIYEKNELVKKLFKEFISIIKGTYIQISAFLLCAVFILLYESEIKIGIFLLLYCLMLLSSVIVDGILSIMLQTTSFVKKILFINALLIITMISYLLKKL